MIPDVVLPDAPTLLPYGSAAPYASNRMPFRFFSFRVLEDKFLALGRASALQIWPRLEFTCIVFPQYGILALPVVFLIVRAGVVGIDCDLYGPAVGLVRLPPGVFEEASDRWDGDGDQDADDGDDDDELDERDAGLGRRPIGLTRCAEYSIADTHGYTSSV